MELELLYFNIAGKGEAIRLACAYAGLNLKDTRLSRDEFVALKESGQLPYGQVPQLIINKGEGRISQSAAIMRYIGRLAPEEVLYPSDLLEAAFVDSIIDQENDLFTGLSVSRYRGRFGFESIGNPGDPVFDQVRKDLNDEVLPRHLSSFERIMQKSTTGWVAGTPNPTIADFILVPRLQWLANHGEGISLDILKPYPGLLALVDKLLNLPAIKSYYAKS